MRLNLNNDEEIVRKSRGGYRANYLNPFGWAGGKWYLTNQRLFFELNLSNIEKCDKSISLDEIVAIEAKHSAFLSSKLSLLLSDNTLVELRVPHRKLWLSEIGNLIKDTKNAIDDWEVEDLIRTDLTVKPRGWLIRVVIQIVLIIVFVSLGIYFFALFL